MLPFLLTNFLPTTWAACWVRTVENHEWHAYAVGIFEFAGLTVRAISIQTENIEFRFICRGNVEYLLCFVFSASAFPMILLLHWTSSVSVTSRSWRVLISHFLIFSEKFQWVLFYLRYFAVQSIPIVRSIMGKCPFPRNMQDPKARGSLSPRDVSPAPCCSAVLCTAHGPLAFLLNSPCTLILTSHPRPGRCRALSIVVTSAIATAH